jgi:hypothetical protein
LYGVGNRAANPTRSGQWRCTVCTTLHGSVNVTTAAPVKAKPAEPEKKEPVKKEPEKKMAKDNKGKSTGKPEKEKKKSLKGTKR